jgi:hypothetical protein
MSFPRTGSVVHMRHASSTTNVTSVRAAAAAAASASRSRPPGPGFYPRDTHVLVSPFFGMPASKFLTLLLNHMRWHMEFGVSK